MDQAPPKQSLTDFLSSCRQEGVESEGEFTLDPGRARQLLRDCQLADPHQYLMHLVSFVVGLHPARVELESQFSGGVVQVRLNAPDVELSLKELQNPFSGLLGHSRKHLQELAVGLNAALGLDGATVVFKSGPYQALYSKDEITTEEPGYHFPGLCIEVQRNLASRISRKIPELSLVSHQFVHCPIPLILDGNPISNPIEIAPGGFKMLLSNEREPLWVDKPEEVQVEAQQAEFSALIMLGDVAPALDILVLGRLYPQRGPWSLEGSGWNCRVVISTSRFNKDLSQQSILQDRIFQNLMGYLRSKLLAGLAQRLEGDQSDALPGALVDLVVDHSRAQGKTQRALELQERQYAVDQASRSRLRKALGSYRLGLLYQAHDETRAAALLKSAETDFRSWRPTRDMVYEGHEVVPQVYRNWVKVKSRHWLCDPDAQLQEDLLQQARASRGCPPMEEICYRWALEAHPPGEHMEARLRWGEVLYEMQRYSDSRRVLMELHSSLDEAVSSPFRWRTEELLGQTCGQLGDNQEGIRYLSSALQRKRDRFGDRSPELGVILKKLTFLLELEGDTETLRRYRNWLQTLGSE